jgi:hypothetical protein
MIEVDRVRPELPNAPVRPNELLLVLPPPKLFDL